MWFDPGIGYLLPGEVADFSRPAQVITVQALISGKVSPEAGVVIIRKFSTAPGRGRTGELTVTSTCASS